MTSPNYRNIFRVTGPLCGEYLLHDCKSCLTPPTASYFDTYWCSLFTALLWRHNGRGGVSNHQPHDCLLNRLCGRQWKKTSKLRVTGLCAGNSPGTDEFLAQMASNAENVSIWWRHHGLYLNLLSLHCPPRKAVHVPGKFHGPGGHNKCNSLQDRAIFPTLGHSKLS